MISSGPDGIFERTSQSASLGPGWIPLGGKKVIMDFSGLCALLVPVAIEIQVVLSIHAILDRRAVSLALGFSF